MLTSFGRWVCLLGLLGNISGFVAHGVWHREHQAELVRHYQWNAPVVSVPEDATWDVRLTEPRSIFGESHGFQVMEMDGERLVIGSEAGIEVWDLKRERRGRELSPLPGKIVMVEKEGSRRETLDRLLAQGEAVHSKNVWPEYVSAAGERVLCCRTEGIPRLWDLATGATTVLEPPIGLIHLGLKGSSVLSPDGKSAYFAGRREYAVGVLDIERGTWSELKGEREAKGPREMTFIHEFLSQVTLSGDGKYLAATGMYRPTMVMPSLEVKPEVFVWETSSRKQVQRLRGVSGSGTMRFMPDGGRIVVGTREGRLEFWNVAKGEPEREFGSTAGEALQDFSISPDGKLIVTTSTFSDLNRNVKQREAYLQVWDVATGKEQMRLTSPAGWGRTELAVAKDWSRLAWWVSGDQMFSEARMKALPGERRDRSGGEVWVWDAAVASHRKSRGESSE